MELGHWIIWFTCFVPVTESACQSAIRDILFKDSRRVHLVLGLKTLELNGEVGQWISNDDFPTPETIFACVGEKKQIPIAIAIH